MVTFYGIRKHRNMIVVLWSLYVPQEDICTREKIVIFEEELIYCAF